MADQKPNLEKPPVKVRMGRGGVVGAILESRRLEVSKAKAGGWAALFAAFPASPHAASAALIR